MTEFDDLALAERPFDEISEFADNPEPRCPCLLLLDTSQSMHGAPIDELNRGIRAFHEELSTDSLAMKRVEIAIVTFGPVNVVTEFQTPDYFSPPTLNASGNTPMGAAIEKGLQLIRDRKDSYRANGITYYQPFVILITDGGPTDSWSRAAELIQDGEKEKGFRFYAIGVKDARMDILKQIAVIPPVALDGLKFREFFIWLSASMSSVSSSQVGDRISLPPIDGWSTIEA